MKRIAIFGKSSYLGNNFAEYMDGNDDYAIDKINSRGDAWQSMDFSTYDVVYFVAGIAHRDANKTDQNLYYDVNTKLALAVAEKAKKDGVKQFILLSSIAVYGLEGIIGKPCNITSDTEEKPVLPYGDSKLKADNVIKTMSDNDFKVAIIRPPMVYGKGCKGNYTRMESLAKKIGVFPKFMNERSMIYVKNLDEFVKLCIDNDVCGIFYPQNKDYVSTYEMYSAIRSAMGKKTWKTRLCNWGIKLLGNKIRTVRKLLGNDTIDKSLSNTFDFEYAKYNMEESIKDIYCDAGSEK